jgi:hypothetical protein
MRVVLFKADSFIKLIKVKKASGTEALFSSNQITFQKGVEGAT